MTIMGELRRRGVLRVGSAYVIGAWLVAQVAEFITETFASPLWVLRTLVVLLAVTLVPVLVFTWMFEFTPAGLRRQSDLDRAGVVVARSGRRLDYLIAVLLLIAAGWLAWEWGTHIRATEQAVSEQPVEPAAALAPPNTLAVLPLLNLSTAPDSEVLADGIAEEILGVLGRNRSLRVTARSSAFQFKDQHRDLREVGRILGVRYLLEGSLRLAGLRVKVGTQLVDAASGVQLWSGSYERTLADLFALQEEIAAEVAKALQIVVTAQNTAPAARGTASVEAHMELLRALQVGASRRVEDLDQAIGMLQRALALDPQYSAAYVELAYAIHARALQRGEDQAALPTIAPLIEKALALNPQSGEALVLRGSLLMSDDARAGEETIRAGLVLAPSHSRGYELLAERIGGRDGARVGEALALIDQAIALDPLSPRNHHMKGILLWHGTGDLAAARVHFARALEIEPRFRNAVSFLLNASMMSGEFAAAVDYAERQLEIDPDDPGFREQLVLQYLNIGDLAAARAVSATASGLARIAVMAAAGDTDGAIEQLRSLDEPLGGLPGNALWQVLALRHATIHGSWEEDLGLSLRGFGDMPVDQALPEAIAFPIRVALLRGAGQVAEADALEAAALTRLDRLGQQQLAWLAPMLDWQRAMLLAGAGRHQEALDALERAFETARPMWWVMLDDNPLFDALREEPRYQALRARLDEKLHAERALLAEKRRVRGVAAAQAVPPQGD